MVVDLQLIKASLYLDMGFLGLFELFIFVDKLVLEFFDFVFYFGGVSSIGLLEIMVIIDIILYLEIFELFLVDIEFKDIMVPLEKDGDVGS